jgi:hypothetical protein
LEKLLSTPINQGGKPDLPSAVSSALLAGPIFYNGKPAISLGMMATFHDCPKKTVLQAFRRNRQHLIPGEDFVEIPAAEFNRLMGEENANPKVYNLSPLAHARGRNTVLLFETGYLLLSKPMTDNEAWRVMRALVASYFKAHPVTDSTPAANLALLMAKLDALAARVEARDALLTPETIAEVVAPKVAEILRPQFSATIAQLSGSISQLSRQLEEVKNFLRCDAINGRHNIRQFITSELEKLPSAAPSPLSSASLQAMSEAPSSVASRALSEAWARLIAAWWNMFGGKLRPAREIVALAEAGLFDAPSQAGRSRQFAVAAERCEGALYFVQDGALKVRLRRGERKAGSPTLYCLEPEL